MKSKNCKECPWLIRNKHNDSITSFSERTGKAHNCHMTEGVKDFWNPSTKHVCNHFRTKETVSYNNKYVHE